MNVNTKGYSLLILKNKSVISWVGGIVYGSNNTYDDDLHICEALTLF